MAHIVTKQQYQSQICIHTKNNARLPSPKYFLTTTSRYCTYVSLNFSSGNGEHFGSETPAIHHPQCEYQVRAAEVFLEMSAAHRS